MNKMSLGVFFVLLSSVIGYSSPSAGNGNGNGRNFGSTKSGHASGIVQQELNVGKSRVNVTSWGTVVEATFQNPFDWMKLSEALDTLEGKEFETNLHNSQGKGNQDVFERAGESGNSDARPAFTYHRVLTFPRNGHKPSAIAAVSASPTSSRSTTSFKDDILSSLVLESKNNPNNVLSYSPPPRTQPQRWFFKLSDHYIKKDSNGRQPSLSSSSSSLNWFKYTADHQHHHPKRHEPLE